MFDLKLDRVSKRYFLDAGAGQPRPARLWGPKRELWAVRDVSFEVERGEALGIVGHNGAGKSTILKLLSSITAPTVGEITIRGRLAALIEIRAGFHLELTGRENIYLDGSILGMSRREINAKVKSIVEFAGIEDYIDVPAKKYSSGMLLRLGFAIAAHLEPDILLLDEVLAVGDAAFQIKCLDRIAELRRAGCTIVLITHDLAALGRTCDRALLMQQGRMLRSGSPREVIDEYLTLGFGSNPAPPAVGAPARLAECRSLCFQADDAGAVRTGYPMTARLSYQAAERLADVVFKIAVYWPSGYLCAEMTTGTPADGNQIEPGPGVAEFHCPALPFQPGLYRVDVALESRGVLIDSHRRSATLTVNPGKFLDGDFYFPHTWRIVSGRGASLGE